MRKLRHKPMDVCQNCKHGNNKKGKWMHTWKRKNMIGSFYVEPKGGFWHVYCVKKDKYYPWDSKKRCIERRVY